jgi:hypothetical protein
VSLSPGTRLGPYEILAPLGAGGMGEVYRAKDTKLDREVAIKVLPSHLAQDASALARFEREAKAVASLTHPNILAIFDFGQQDEIAFAVTELLEGETLRGRLSTGPLPVRKAVEYGVQIAHGLAAAHGKGIVHRDLKPENVFVTEAGHVKILDFGLARVTGSASDSTQSPTAVAATEPGTVMGTVGYMSPEQVRGKPADHRSDIFSFGAILYEMLSGRRAFTGESAAETMAAIAKEDPPEISATNASVPVGLDEVVHHCLEKSPAERFQTATDLAFALQALSGHSTPRSGMAALPGRKHSSRGLQLALLGAAIAAAVGSFVAARRGHVELPTFHRLTFERGIVEAARFSADGHTIVYSAAWNGDPAAIFSTRSGASESRALGYPDTALLALSASDELALSVRHRPAWEIYWSVGTGTLARAPLAGGEPREDLEGVHCADFSRDGQSLAVVRRQDGKTRLEYPMGKLLYETSGWISDPRISPSDDRVAFLEHPTLQTDEGSVSVVDRQGRTTTLARGFVRLEGLAWSPKGDEIWFTATRTGSARALRSVTLAGKERVLLRVPGALTIFDVAKDGRVLLAQESLRREVYGRAPDATAERDLSWLDYASPQGISNDGSIFTFGEFGEAGGTGRSYVRKTDGTPAVRLAEGDPIAISGDARWVLAQTPGDLMARQFVLLPTGPGQPQPISTEPMNYEGGAFVPDGKRVVLVANRPGHRRQVFVQAIDGGGPRPVTPEGIGPGAIDFLPSISPDGRFIVVRDKAESVFLWPLEGGPPRQVSWPVAGQDCVVNFTSDGRGLLILQGNAIPARVSRLNITTGEKQPLLELTPRDPAGVVGIDNLNMTRDGRAYVYSFVRRLCDLYVVEGLH